ncbi:hypothetical protein DSO57_1038554 [Entomophthora muscae]|uniref:Uncharacterized protein n=1 Tax=Entomophthora muscae TaxID=34485 RepID=A0ACC2T9Q8_9FUNG|nr:hypothetical protein DSO57_1038554 [Entomophthora muscae]
MKCEFASQITTYLQTQVTRGKHANPSITNLASIIDYYTEQNYSVKSLRPANCNQQAFSLLRQETQYNITRLFTRHKLHAMAIPSFPAVAAYTPANIAGYPIITLPLPKSLAISFYSLQGSDALLLKLASLMEAANITHRSPPRFNSL